MPKFIEYVLEEKGYFSPWFLKMYESGRLSRWWEMIETDNLVDQKGEE